MPKTRAAAGAAAAAAAAADTTTTGTTSKEQQQPQASSTTTTMPMPISKKKPNDMSLQNLADLVDYHVEMILLQKANRNQHWEALKFFWSIHPANDFNYGRLHNRVRLAELLHLACSTDAYDYDDEEKKSSLLSLVQWPRDTWSELSDLLEELHTDLQRQDATAEFKQGGKLEDLELENDEPVRDAEEELAQKKLERLQTLVEIHQILAPIRVPLQQHLNDPYSSVPIPNKVIQKVGIDIFRLENPTVKAALQLLVEESSTSTRQKKHFQLVEWDQVRAVLDDKTFDLCYFQNKMECLVHQWNNTVFVGSDPELIRSMYRMSKDARNMLSVPKERRVSLVAPTTPRQSRKKQPPPAGRQQQEEEDVCPAPDDDQEEDANKKPRAKTEAEILALRKGRETLGQHVDDPLEESQLVAAGAKKRRAQDKATEEEKEDEDETISPAAKRAKTAARALQISEDLDEDDQEEEEERAKLSRLPPKARISPASSAKKYKGPPPDEGIFFWNGKVLKRRRWTEEEKIAVKEGIQMHGIGKWKEIKQSYAEILRNRTPVQIKDCWRTMSKRNEVYEV